MTSLKVMTLWVRPSAEETLPEAKALLEGLLQAFYEAFPEYDGVLAFTQSPRLPRYVFVYASQGCTGLLPQAGRFLQDLLQHAFPGTEVRPYGKVWSE